MFNDCMESSLNPGYMAGNDLNRQVEADKEL
jgi:hypothetical protein